jgi:Immunity protein 21
MTTRLPHQRGSLQWLDNDAGASMLLSTRLLSRWSGSLPPSDGRVIEAEFRWNPADGPTDYDRACDVNEAAAVLPVGDGSAIVLGNEGPMPVTWRPLASGGILLVQLYTTETGDMPARLPRIPSDLEWATGGAFHADGAPLRLFDATDSGEQDPVFPYLTVELAAGAYAVESAVLETPRMTLWLVRLRPA